MRKLTFLLAIALLGLSMVVMTSQVTFAEDQNNEGKEPPTCRELPNAKSLGKNIESGCRVPAIRNKREAVHSLNKKYENAMASRYGRTYYNSSESWSDLVEDRIKVRAMYYSKNNPGDSWFYKDQCSDHDEWSSHAACQTHLWNHSDYHKQKAYHQFQASGFENQNFTTETLWIQ